MVQQKNKPGDCLVVKEFNVYSVGGDRKVASSPVRLEPGEEVAWMRVEYALGLRELVHSKIVVVLHLMPQYYQKKSIIN